MSGSSIQDLLGKYQVGQSGKYISREFQDYAYRLAAELQGGEPDPKTVGMCMRLVKKKPRALLEQAKTFVSDANARNKTALFLWKIKQLEQAKKSAT